MIDVALAYKIAGVRVGVLLKPELGTKSFDP